MKEQNRIRQMAIRAREKMPKDYRSFCLVAAHLVKNAHRYYPDAEFESVKKEELSMSERHNCTLNLNTSGSTTTNADFLCKEVNTIIHQICTLKRQNRIIEQQEMVVKLKEVHGSYRSLSKVSGIPLKTVHGWCAIPKNREHRGTSRANLRREEFTNFLMQDTISYSYPCKKYAGKKFLLYTWDEIFKRYHQQPEFHKHGVISRTTMRMYKPKYILLSGSTPANQCLCDLCENCELLRKALLAAGVREIPHNKYACVDATLCSIREGKFRTAFKYPPMQCIKRDCEDCGQVHLRNSIYSAASNEEILKLNRRVTWHRWQTLEDRKVPQKCQIRGTLKAAVNEFLELVEDISGHLFRANWHRNVFQYIRGHLQEGYVLQVMDFAMNFSNRYQDEVQSAYFGGTQTTIHATINFFKCRNKGCSDIVTLALVHISEDLKHDSFLSRAAMNMTFQYLVSIGIPLELVIQFCDNCSAQYKSRRPFVEIARCALELIRVYFGEKHGKSHADGLFGRLKAWMSYKIKARHFVVTCGYNFFKFCREFYQTKQLQGEECQHYRVEFEFIRPSDIRRHQDSDLDQAVPQTHQIYSVRNTAEPLQLKVRNVPCLCPPCIKGDEDCWNKSHSDPWRLINMVPERGANLRKYQKRKHPEGKVPKAKAKAPPEKPAICISYNEQIDISSDDEDLESIVFEETNDGKGDKHDNNGRVKSNEQKNKAKKKNSKRNVTEAEFVTDTVTDTQSVTANGRCTWVNPSEEIIVEDFIPESKKKTEQLESEDIEIIEVCQRASQEFKLSLDNLLPTAKFSVITSEDIARENVPDCVLWTSLLTACESAHDYRELENKVWDFYEHIPPLKKRVEARINSTDKIDSVAQKEIPVDGPDHLVASYTIGDGNCLCRALSRSFFNDDSRHIELRVRILFEAVINKDKYLNDSCLERGATYIHSNADLPTVFSTFSEYYTPGQRLTEDSITAIYCLETHSLASMSTYMGLWQ